LRAGSIFVTGPNSYAKGKPFCLYNIPMTGAACVKTRYMSYEGGGRQSLRTRIGRKRSLKLFGGSGVNQDAKAY
jgi:hypothetical protein